MLATYLGNGVFEITADECEPSWSGRRIDLRRYRMDSYYTKRLALV